MPAILRTLRLVLRPFTLADAPVVQELAAAREVALNTLLIPHPYPDGAAEEWIRRQEGRADHVTFAILLGGDGALIGAISLMMKAEHDVGEIGYWIGVPYWNRGYATEAIGAVIDYGFSERSLERIEAFHFTRNAASGRAMVKNGMRHEGTMRHARKKWGEYVDLECYALLRGEWSAREKRQQDEELIGGEPSASSR